MSPASQVTPFVPGRSGADAGGGAQESQPNYAYIDMCLCQLEAQAGEEDFPSVSKAFGAFNPYYLNERQKYTDLGLLKAADSRMYRLEAFLVAHQPQLAHTDPAAFPQQPRLAGTWDGASRHAARAYVPPLSPLSLTSHAAHTTHAAHATASAHAIVAPPPAPEGEDIAPPPALASRGPPWTPTSAPRISPYPSIPVYPSLSPDISAPHAITPPPGPVVAPSPPFGEDALAIYPGLAR